jgi:endonuclease G, mitochondrial
MKIAFLSAMGLSALLSCALFQPTSHTAPQVEAAQKSVFWVDTTIGKLLYYKHMVVSFSASYKQPLWVAYKLCDSMLEKNVKRLAGFRVDSEVKQFSATDADYKGSGYDKGHLKPAANCTWDSVAMFESFYYTNVSPQLPSFNRGIWSRLEDMERNLTAKYACVHVVNMPIFDTILAYIGPGKVPVPHAFGKAFLVEEQGVYKCIAFLLHNEAKPSGYDLLNKAAITVDSLEKRTGINLFWHLPDSTQTRMEAIIAREIVE